MLGGPGRYTEKLGGYEGMLAHHRGLVITPEERFRFASLLSLAADDAGLPDDPEFRSALVAYVEWGTQLAMHNSHPGAEVAEHAPVPRWAGAKRPHSSPSEVYPLQSTRPAPGRHRLDQHGLPPVSARSGSRPRSSSSSERAAELGAGLRDPRRRPARAGPVS